jgi:penicillin-binding protein 1A
LLLGLAVAGGILLQALNAALPDSEALRTYQPPLMTRAYAGDGQVVGEFARERRIYLPIDAIPRQVTSAFLSAEDKNFYEHDGVDGRSIVRAILGASVRAKAWS